MHVNSAQKLFTYLGYRCNTFARVVARDIEQLSRPHHTAQICKILSLFFSIPLAIVLFVPAMSCYAIAACVGKGRFERIESKGQPWNKREVRVMSLNACFQDPWAPLTGGVVTPFERVRGFPTRIAAVAAAIEREDPDLFLGQEFDDIGAQDRCIGLLKQKGFRYFLRDLGSHDPTRNHSGLFVASKVALENVEFHPYAIEDRARLAKRSCQGALTFTTRVQERELRWINVHLNYGESDEEQAARNRQLTRYVLPLLRRGPAVLMGDLNFDTSKVDRAASGLLGLTNAIEGQITCTDAGKRVLRGKEGSWQGAIDGLIYDPARVQLRDARVLPMMSEGELLSDHSAVVATIFA